MIGFFINIGIKTLSKLFMKFIYSEKSTKISKNHKVTTWQTRIPAPTSNWSGYDVCLFNCLCHLSLNFSVLKFLSILSYLPLTRKEAGQFCKTSILERLFTVLPNCRFGQFHYSKIEVFQNCSAFLCVSFFAEK